MKKALVDFLFVVNVIALVILAASAFLPMTIKEPSITVNGLRIPCSLYNTGPARATWVCIRAQ
ncbi:hypothetical protein MINTMi27_15430 [Mycobacterium intracellulare]|uniref:hypothetical protein n=1 Tax=Mycobacterium intracellulare TaxID=1767 RepID=UPI0019285CF5|nr:hypothetical protein [Mycobacterium intracellulare]BCP41450.1 hypothetical protein MINTMi27_15430 [Mycobacterium intracellulare]